MSGSKLFPYALVLACVAVLVIGQVLFKEFSLRLNKVGSFMALSVEDYAVFALAGVLYATSSVIWVIALREIPLSRAYPFMALGYILVPLAALAFYGEQLSFRYFLGVLIIIVGLIVTATPSPTE